MAATAKRPLVLERFLTEVELAERLDRNRCTLMRWRNRKRNPLPHIRLGEGPCAPILYDPAAVDRWSEEWRKNTEARVRARKAVKA
jgi:hypothetical protein